MNIAGNGIKFSKAITRKPGPGLVRGISTANLGIPDYAKALEQHAAYVQALIDCGLEVVQMEAENDFPDSTFVEDVAICTPRFVVICRPGAPSRQGEVELIRDVLSQNFLTILEIQAPATLEGGDVMRVGDHFYIGLSARTNLQGAKQFISMLEQHGLTGSAVDFKDILHLKTGISYLENNNYLVCESMAKLPFVKDFNLIPVDLEEEYAANCIWVNGNVLVPSGFPKVRSKVIDCGYKVIELEMSEFQKLDGGLSCLSLRF